MINRRDFIAISSSVATGAVLHSLPAFAQPSLPNQLTDAIAACRALLLRLVADRANDFDLHLIPQENDHEIYAVSSAHGRVRVSGSNAVSLARGVYAYLRETGLGMVSWSGSRLQLPAVLPDLSEQRVASPYKFVQYYNVCTYGYTTAFWNWERWERELDWMALHGINMPLAMDGQEAIWQTVWKQLGITQAELDRHFTGPAYLPWHRMGNIDYFEGPLPQGWIDQKHDLQIKIIHRMRELDMTPVVPAFAGFVPEAFKRIYPQAKLFTELWSKEMPRQSKTLILDPSESDFYKEINKGFIHEYKQQYGEVEYYLADTFNEMDVPVGADPEADLARFARTVYNGILAGDPNGKWVMQGWLFFNDAKFWQNKEVSAFLSDIPNDRMVIIDFANDSNAEVRNADPTIKNGWNQHEAFFGKSWINGMIHTFGGNNNVKGNLPLIAAQAATVLASPQKGNLVGWGMDPEGIENNEVVYELMTDVGWSSSAIDLTQWIPAYCRARYGDCPPAMAEAWSLLLKSAYAWHTTWNSHHGWQTRPSLKPTARGIDSSPEFHQAVERFVADAEALQSSDLYRNDLIELVCQSVGIRIDAQLLLACQAHEAGKPDLRDQAAKSALNMLHRVDALMNLRVDRRLETWVSAAKSWAVSADEKAYYDRDARRVITFWGWTGLNDYASRVWSGLTRDYYAGRWSAFFQGLQINHATDMDVWEESWLLTPYVPSQPGVVSDLAKEAHLMLQESKAWSGVS